MNSYYPYEVFKIKSPSGEALFFVLKKWGMRNENNFEGKIAQLNDYKEDCSFEDQIGAFVTGNDRANP